MCTDNLKFSTATALRTATDFYYLLNHKIDIQEVFFCKYKERVFTFKPQGSWKQRYVPNST